MHELAICQAMLAEVTTIAQARHATGVTDIHVGIGPLSGVEPGLLRDAFPIAAAGTVAESAALHLRMTPVRVLCNECGDESDARANKLICGSCGAWQTSLASGDELLLERVEMETRRENRTTGEFANV